MLDYLPSVAHLGFIEAVARGFYEEAGLDVEIVPGRGSAGTAQLVGAGRSEFGFADGAATAGAIATGVPVKMVASFFQRGANSIAFLCSHGIKEPEDLSGKTVGGPAGAAGFVALTAAMEKANASEPYKATTVSPEAKINAMMGEKIYAMTSTVYDLSLAVSLEAKGKQVCQIPISDWGVPMMGHGIIVSNQLIESDPELIKKFVRASVQGWKSAVENPNRAIDDLFEQFPDANSAEAANAWKGIPLMFHTENSEDAPLGWMAPEDWESTLELLVKGGLLPKPVDAEEVFTNEFVED
jgi:NitT/TauT family transport system substrate-binding protein